MLKDTKIRKCTGYVKTEKGWRNKPGEPFFYCSDEYMAACEQMVMELDALIWKDITDKQNDHAE